MSKVKKIVISVICLLLVLCLTVGGIFTYRWYSMKKNPVGVIPVSDINNSWYSDYSNDEYLDGEVKKGMSQVVMYDPQLTITEILVKKGDTVDVGTPLIKYDTTLLNLQMQIKENEIQTIDMKLEALRKKIITLKGTKTASAGYDFNSSDASDKSGEAFNVSFAAPDKMCGVTNVSFAVSGNTSGRVTADRLILRTVDEPETQETEESEAQEEPAEVIADISAAYKGNGTVEEPFTFKIKPGTSIDASLISKAVEGGYVCCFEVAVQDNPEIIFIHGPLMEKK
ncbi:MAG: hypothetical protein IJM37_03370 [Lachnospiraceae bacterium]|nr:hypothetical protein [Lachnospiraceae bacterium]